VSVGAIAPSIEQYAGAFPVAATQRGSAKVTPATGSPIDDTGIEFPSLALVQSPEDIARLSCGAAAVEDRALKTLSKATPAHSAARIIK
jgi:hypothetical protein